MRGCRSRGGTRPRGGVRRQLNPARGCVRWWWQLFAGSLAQTGVHRRLGVFVRLARDREGTGEALFNVAEHFRRHHGGTDPTHRCSYALPYIDFGVFAIQEWRRIGLKPSPGRSSRQRGSRMDATRGTSSRSSAEPQLHGRSRPVRERSSTDDSSNWRRFSDPRIDDLFARQTRALDPSERKRLVNEIVHWAR